MTDKPWSASTGYGVGAVRARSDDPALLAVAAVDFAIRRRVRSDIELALGVGGMVARGYGLFALYADVRYRFIAERAWNPYVSGGLGAGGGEGSDRFALVLRAGVGLERRFERWAFSGDLQLARLSGDEMVPVRDDGSEQAHFGALGAGVSISATYY